MTKALFAFSVLTSLSFSDTITLTTGETIEGELVETQAGFVLLQLPDDEGEAIRRISPEKVETLAFSDREASLDEKARTRAKFVSLLSEEDAQILPKYLNDLIAEDHALPALSYAKLWHPKNQHPSLDSSYREILMDAALAASLQEEALVHAQEWLSQDPPPLDRTLPWEVQAQHLMDTERFEEALWTCLTPIAHANHRSQGQLGTLREIASQAYHELGYAKHSLAYLSANPLPSKALHFAPQKPPQ